jgi:hypothetical protein
MIERVAKAIYEADPEGGYNAAIQAMNATIPPHSKS